MIQLPSGMAGPRGASASSRKKTERPRIGLLLWLSVVVSVCVVVCTVSRRGRKIATQANRHRRLLRLTR